MKRQHLTIYVFLLAFILFVSSYQNTDIQYSGPTPNIQTNIIPNEPTAATVPERTQKSSNTAVSTDKSKSTPLSLMLDNIPEYSGRAYITVNNNEPYFNASELKTSSFETYSNLDSLGRCGTAFASVGQDIMPTEKRGVIS